MRRFGFVLLLLCSLWTSCERQSLVLLSEPGGSDAAIGPDTGCGSAGTSQESFMCTQSGDCGSYRPHCDVSTQECVECLTAAHCNEPETCEFSTHPLRVTVCVGTRLLQGLGPAVQHGSSRLCRVPG